ncbi:MAG: transposase [Verrucomicrobia subdivision 3 bacterium]|nr:transposase [Gemmataceae bacterium]MCI0748752.1 transposase [Limisphaerales bacterium]
MAVSIAPTILISDFIWKIKGASSHEVNQKLGGQRKILEWQAGYGVVSFGTKDLPWVKQLIQNQKEHHRVGKTVDQLERIAREEEAEAEHREAP